MPSERRNFQDIIEPIVYWDASFAIALSIDGEPYHDESAGFYNRLESEGALSLSSEFVYDELIFYMVKGVLIAEGKATSRHWMDVKRERPNLTTSVMPKVNEKIAELERMTMKLPIEDTVTARAAQLMADYGILPTDAYHIAIALDSGINSFVSLDEDFLRIDGIIVYTCLP
jgi:predicted nucleic acid-binding protein